MSREPSIQSEDDHLWTTDDVEQSLLDKAMNGQEKKEHRISRWAQLKGCSAYLVISFCFGALLSGTVFSLLHSSVQFGTFGVSAQNDQSIQKSQLSIPLAGSLKTVRFEGTFDRTSSGYKGPPSPKVDALWEEVTGLGVMSISEQVYEQLNASTYAVKVPQSLGGGRMAIFEAVHQIHCVQALWQAAYPEYYVEQHEFKLNHPGDWYDHLDHCADMLRQKLMCDADMNLVTYNWVKGHTNPHPNFNVQHQCRDFDAVLNYAREHQLDKNNAARIDVNLLKQSSQQIMEFENEPPFDPNAIPVQLQRRQ